MNAEDHSKPYVHNEADPLNVFQTKNEAEPSLEIGDPEGSNVHAFEPLEPSANEAEDYKIRTQILEQELDRTKDQMIRALAEADNTRKRAMREREDATKFAVSSFSRDLLSVADNLRRALNAVPPELANSNPEVKTLLSGIEATERELLKTFEKNGIQKIEPLDDMYNPHFHEVIFEAVIPNKPGGTIIQVVEPGYVLNGRVLRPARVGVAKSEDSSGQSGLGQTINTQI